MYNRAKVKPVQKCCFKIEDKNDCFFFGLDDNYLYFYTNYKLNMNEKVFIIENNNIFYPFINKLYLNIKNTHLFENEEKNTYINKLNKYSNTPIIIDNMVDYHSDDEDYDFASAIKLYPKNNNLIVKFTKGSRNLNKFYVKINTKVSRYRCYYIAFLKMYMDLIKYYEEKEVVCMNEEIKKILGDKVLTSNVFAGIYNIDIPIREEQENITTIKLYEGQKKGLIYRHIENINEENIIKYYDINTGIEVNLNKDGKYLPIKSVYLNIYKYIATDTLLALAQKYERQHLDDSKLYNLDSYVYQGNSKIIIESLLDIENYYITHSYDNNIKKLSK